MGAQDHVELIRPQSQQRGHDRLSPGMHHDRAETDRANRGELTGAASRLGASVTPPTALERTDLAAQRSTAAGPCPGRVALLARMPGDGIDAIACSRVPIAASRSHGVVLGVNAFTFRRLPPLGRDDGWRANVRRHGKVVQARRARVPAMRARGGLVYARRGVRIRRAPPPELALRDPGVVLRPRASQAVEYTGGEIGIGEDRKLGVLELDGTHRVQLVEEVARTPIDPVPFDERRLDAPCAVLK